MRTITQRTTLPFLMAESGAASLTLAVTTSPRPACRPLSPPRGRMHCSLRAPLLSGTSRMVLIPIMWLLSPRRRFRARDRLRAFEQRFRRDANLHGFSNDFAQPPALQLVDGAAFNDANDVAELG